MLWPSVEDLRDAPWKGELAWDEGPPLPDVVVALIPALRVLFLQGWRTVSINFAEGMSTGQSTDWRSLDVATLELTTEMLSFDREWSGLNVAFDVVPMNDTHGPAENGYSMWVEVLSLGIDEPMATNGKIPHDLEVSIDDFVETGVEHLAALIPNAQTDPPRADNQGLLWVFDAGHWWGLPHYGEVAVDYATQLLREGPADFIRGQVYDDSRKHDKKFYLRRRHPDLGWLFNRPSYSSVFEGQFWQQIAKALQGRGEAHRLTIADRGRLPTIGWLDAIIELLTLGAIDADGLITPVEPVEPLVAHTIDDETAKLVVWGEQTINLIRHTPLLHKRSLEGSVAWDYWEGDADNQPRVLLVVSRGITIGDAWTPDFPWVLDIIRVQDDSLVPSEGEAIDPTLILSPALLEPQPGERGPLQWDGSPEPVWTNMYPRVAAKPKRDGLFLEFPIFGESVDPAEPSVNESAVPLGTPDRFGVELTLDPRSGSDGFIVDVHYYTANFGPNMTGGAHICVWASEGVTINANGTPNDGFSDATSQASQMLDSWSAWTASAEFWEADQITFIKRPFQGQLQITPRLAHNDDRIDPSVPRFSDDANAIEFLDPNTNDVTWLRPKHYTFKNFHYEDSFLFDFVDAVFGFVPFIGDAADIAEVAYIWTTGYDKWGRPVSNFQRGLMTVGAAVPLLSAGFVGKAARLVEGSPEALVHGVELGYLMQQAGRGMDPDIDDVEAALSVSSAWQTDKRLNTASRKAMTAEMIDFIAKNPALIEEWATKLVAGSGDEWLALPDILDDATGGFRINSIQVQYLSWAQKNLGATPEQFIESGGLSGRAKVMAEALLGNEAVGGALRASRRAAKRTGYPSALGRHAIGGVGLKLAQMTAEQVATQLTTYVTAVLTTVSKNRVYTTGALRPVTTIVSHPVAFFVDGARAMLQELSPTTPLNQLTANMLEALLGKDNLNGVLVSLEERAARFADGLFTAYAELKEKGIAVETLFTENMLPVTMAFVRSFVARVGKENGARFELRIAALLEIELRPPLLIAIRHQLKLPTLLKKGPLSGPDSVLYMLGKAILVQLKSYARIEDLVDGPVEVAFDAAGNIVSVTAPSLVQQVIKDAARLKHWNYKIPPPGVEWNFVDPPGDQSDWIDIGDVHALVIDDVYLRDQAFALLSKASKDTKKRKINIMQDVDAPERVKESLRAILGDEVYPERGDYLDGKLYEWVVAHAGDAEDIVNEVMERPDIVAALGGRKLQFKVFLGTQPTTFMHSELVEAAAELAEAP